MYTIITAVRNLLRYKTRYIITGLFLLFLFTCVFCLLFYNACIPAYIVEVEENCRKEFEPEFRDDLQYRNENGRMLTESVGGFNADGSMDKYNYPIYYEKELFEEIGSLPGVTKSYINYAVTVCVTKNRYAFIYGGDFESVKKHSWSSDDIDGYEIIEGRENLPGECMIHADFAEEYEISVGDMLTYYDENMNILGSIYVSGIYTVHYNSRNGKEKCILLAGSNPFFREAIKSTNIIITDFDTAYNINGDLHEFNDYCIWYEIDTDAASFCAEANKYLGDETLEFDWNHQRYNELTYSPKATMRTSWKFMGILLALAAVITAAITIYSCTERRRDFGILYALGADNRSMTLMFGLETALFMTLIQFIAIFTGRFLLYISIVTGNSFDYPGLVYRFNALYFAYILLFWSVTVLFTSALSALLMCRKRTIRR